MSCEEGHSFDRDIYYTNTCYSDGFRQATYWFNLSLFISVMILIVIYLFYSYTTRDKTKPWNKMHILFCGFATLFGLLGLIGSIADFPDPSKQFLFTAASAFFIYSIVTVMNTWTRALISSKHVQVDEEKINRRLGINHAVYVTVTLMYIVAFAVAGSIRRDGMTYESNIVINVSQIICGLTVCLTSVMILHIQTDLCNQINQMFSLPERTQRLKDNIRLYSRGVGLILSSASFVSIVVCVYALCQEGFYPSWYFYLHYYVYMPFAAIGNTLCVVSDWKNHINIATTHQSSEDSGTPRQKPIEL